MKDYDYYKPCPLKGNRKIWSLKEKRGYTFDTILQRWYKKQNSCHGRQREICPKFKKNKKQISIYLPYKKPPKYNEFKFY